MRLGGENMTNLPFFSAVYLALIIAIFLLFCLISGCGGIKDNSIIDHFLHLLFYFHLKWGSPTNILVNFQSSRSATRGSSLAYQGSSKKPRPFLLSLLILIPLYSKYLGKVTPDLNHVFYGNLYLDHKAFRGTLNSVPIMNTTSVILPA